MGERPAIKVEGLAQLRRDLREAGGKQLDAELRVMNKQAAGVIARASLPYVPVGQSPYDPHRGQLRARLKGYGGVRTGSVGETTPQGYENAIHWGWPAHGIAGARYIEKGIKAGYALAVGVYRLGMARIAARFNAKR